MYDAKEGKLTATRLGDPRFYLTKVLELSIVTVQGHELGELGRWSDYAPYLEAQEGT